MVHKGNPGLPFGGIGGSGIGRLHGRYGFEEFSNLRSVPKRKLLTLKCEGDAATACNPFSNAASGRHRPSKTGVEVPLHSNDSLEAEVFNVESSLLPELEKAEKHLPGFGHSLHRAPGIATEIALLLRGIVSYSP